MSYPLTGGSVLVSCRLDDKDAQGNLIAHGYVREYHLWTSLIQSQLQTMWANGQRRLSLALPFFTGGDTFALDSTGGKLQPQDAKNLVALVTYAASLGFTDFLAEFLPEWNLAYTNWENSTVMGAGNVRSFQPLAYSEMLGFVLDVDRVLKGTGVTYWVDLLAECSNAKVGSRLWSDWCDQHGGAANCLGFSMVPSQSQIDLAKQLYANGILPNVFIVHPYYNTDGHEMSWPQYKDAMRSAGYQQGFIIGETDTNSPEMAAQINSNRSDLFWLYQWPVGVDTPPNVTQDRLTLEYSAYQAAGL